jgi:DNA modification methylase
MEPTTSPSTLPLDQVIHGDCIDVMRSLPSGCVDFVLTDPPYIARYRSRDGRSIQNDTDDAWLRPGFLQVGRLLKPDRFCISFYGWPRIDRFMAAWRAAGLRPAGHLVFRKSYASSQRFLRYRHEMAYLLVKGNPPLPPDPMEDVVEMPYSGNRLHPTQKPVAMLRRLIEAFSGPGDIVLDPFCGSGSTLVAARRLERRFVGIELDPQYHAISIRRMQALAA